MARENERGFFALGVALPLWTAALLCLSGFFFQYMHMILTEKADLELSEEIHTALQLVLTDAAEAESVEVLGTEKSQTLRFRKAGDDLSGWAVTSYRVFESNGLRKLYRGHVNLGGYQPLTGETILGNVAIDEFRIRRLPNGLYHLRIVGRSLRTGHCVEQTAEFLAKEGG